MDHIENEYRNRFKDQKLPNEGFEMDSLWNDIEKDLSPKTPIEKTPTRKPTLVLAFWTLGLLLLVFFSYQCWNHGFAKSSLLPIEQTEDSNQAVQKEQTKNTSSTGNENKTGKLSTTINESELTTIESVSNDASTKASLKKKSSQTISSNYELIDDPASSSDLNFTHSKDVKNKQTRIPPNGSWSTNKNSQEQNQLNVIKKESFEKIIDVNASSITKQAKEIRENAFKVIAERSNDIAMVTTLTLLPVRFKNLAIQEITFPRITSLTVDPEDSKEKNVQFRLGIYGSASNINFQYQADNPSSLLTLKEETDSGIWGGGTGLEAGLNWNNGFLINSGVEYHLLQSKFDYFKEGNIQVLKEDELLIIWIDQTTNDTIKTYYGDTLVNAIQTREVVHYNQYKLISIPLELGYQKQFNKMTLGISAGISFNLAFSQSGKTVDKNEEIALFDKTSSFAPLQNFSIGYRLSPYVNYQLSEKTSLSFKPRYAAHLNPNFDGSDVKLRLNQMSLNLGIEYLFTH